MAERVHIVFRRAVAEAIAEAGSASAGGDGDDGGGEHDALAGDILLVDDAFTGGPLCRAAEDDWAALRGAWLASERGGSAASWTRAIRLWQARLRALAGYREAVLWCPRDEAGRHALGYAARQIVASPPEGARLSTAWLPPGPAEAGEAGGTPAPEAAELRRAYADRAPVTIPALTEHAFAFEAFVARQSGAGRGALAARVPEAFETERLLLRAPAPGDGREVFAAVTDSRAALAPWMPWIEDHTSPIRSEMHCRDAHLAFLAREDLIYRGFLREPGGHQDEGADGEGGARQPGRPARLVLSTGFHRVDWPPRGDAPGPRLEIGYWVRTGFEGRGYATEAVAALTRLAFHTLACRRLEIRCAASNARSRAIPERLGFRLEARLAHATRLPSGAIDDTLVYVRLPDDAPAAPAGSSG